ncbi:MAG: PQQ-binding-like beta-propeller repeat protein, partial [Planctomycetota bacterium]|nr:PQQ-binding-like beta-propeller repeat protein [Planctomycetota bacterium]
MRLAAFSVLAVLLFLCAGCNDKDKKEKDKEEPPPTKEKKREAEPIRGWLEWRGPQQNGTSLETNLPSEWVIGGKNDLWSYDLCGRGTPVVANGKVYAFGYRGEGSDQHEVLACIDAETGKKIWEKEFTDFLSDIIYSRYSIGEPAIDRETGNVYVLTSPGLFCCFTPDGKKVFEHSMMEVYGRLTFPNGRTGAPSIDGDLVFAHGITSNWGGQGPAGHRLYAFDKKTGVPVYAAGTNLRPKDSCFSTPFFGWLDGKRVFYVGTGDGHVACFNARTGEGIWRYKVTQGGVNSSLVVQDGILVAIHNQENVDSSESGRFLALKVDAKPEKDPENPTAPPVLPRSAELWRQSMGAFSSSPTVVNGVIYQTLETGELVAADLKTGKIMWEMKLGIEQQHASPLYADGKLYMPIKAGDFYIIQPGAAEGKILSQVKVEGDLVGAPSVWNGKIYLFSTKKLYCFGSKGNNKGLPADPKPEVFPAGTSRVALQIIPNEILLRPEQKQTFTVRSIDANGFPVGDETNVAWAAYVPPTAKVKAYLNATFNPQGELVASEKREPSAGAFQATANGVTGTTRGRVMPGIPVAENFDGFQVTVEHATEAGVKFAYPPLPWIGARFKWEIREKDGNKVLTKTIDNKLFQRAYTFIGHSDLKNYTIEADVMSDGNKRKMSEVGLLNQRYC